MDQEEVLRLFKQWYRPHWNLRAFRRSVWLVEYFFDDSGPTDSEFDTLFDLLGDYWAEPREAIRRRLEDCAGFSLGRPYSQTELAYLQSEGIRFATSEIEAGSLQVFTGERYYYFSTAALRKEAAEWMIGQGAEAEWIESP